MTVLALMEAIIAKTTAECRINITEVLVMFVFNAVNEKKSSIAYCNVDQSKISKWFSFPASKRNSKSRTYKKNIFFASTLLPFFLISGHAAANVGGSLNGTLPPGGGDAPRKINSCSDLENSKTRKQCKNFISSYDGEYKIRYLPKEKPITSHDSFTVYILPPGDIPFDDVVHIKDAQNIAFIGDIGTDGKFPTLRGAKSNTFMFRIENCQNCMLANVNIDPVNGNSHSVPLAVTGEKTVIELRNIKATHNWLSFFHISNAESVILDNVGITYDPEKVESESIAYYENVISLHNCDKIKASNVWMYEISKKTVTHHYYPHLIDILNPVDVELEDISIGLSKDHDPAEDVAYIGMAFNNMDKYSQPGGSKVKVEMKGLHFGVYTGKESEKSITVPDHWPENRHILSLSKRPGSVGDTTKVTGEIVIEKNKNLDAIISQPAVQAITGQDLFYNLNVTLTKKIRPALNLSTPSPTFITNSSFIPNSTIIPNSTFIPNSVSLRQTGDDSGFGLGAKLGITAAVMGGAVAVAAIGAMIYKKRHAAAVYVAAFKAGMSETASDHSQSFMEEGGSNEDVYSYSALVSED